MNDDLARDIVSDWERRKGNRGTFESHWQQCADYEMPNRDYIVSRSPGQKRMQRIYDAAPLLAGQEFANGIDSLSTSNTLQWFWMRADSMRLNGLTPVRVWLEDAARAMYKVFSSPRHNFATQKHEVYLDLGNIGSGCMFVLESARSGVLFSARSLRECVWAENEEDQIDNVIRQWQFTARQAVSAWGERCGEKVLKAWKDKPDTPFTFLHAIRPRLKRDPQRAERRHMAWESVYVALDDLHVIDEGGFNEFAALCPRMEKVSGEIYGRSPGMRALPDVKMLYEMKKTLIKAAQKIVDPPMDIPLNDYIMPVKTVPGGLLYYRGTGRARAQAINTEGNLPIGAEMLAGLQQQIRATYYLDKMMMPMNLQKPETVGKNVTATFWLQRRDANLQQLSPLLARQQAEFTGPLIDRVFAILWRRSKALRFDVDAGSPFPPPPPELSGARIHPEYVSPVALAQRSSELDAVARVIDQAAQLQVAGVKDAASYLDAEAILRLTSDDLYAPVGVVKTPERVAQERQAAAEAERMMQNHMALANVAKSAKDGAAAVSSLSTAKQNVLEAPEDALEEAA